MESGKKNTAISQQYIALSYMWGSEDDLDEIYIDDYIVPVRRNLQQALQALNSTDSVKAGCKIWVDALCIDQGSISERNREIKRMRHIYKNAINVVVWLGDAEDGSNAAMDFINNISQARLQGMDNVRLCLRETFAAQGTTIWDDLSTLITRQYFSRLWIIQELAMGGGRETVILCGSRATTWDKLYRVYHSLHIFQGGHSDDELTNTTLEELRSADPAVYEAYRNVMFWKWEKCEDFQILQDSESDNLETNKRHLMTRCRGALCATPLDKVYGILGLLGEGMSLKIVPDYETSVRQAYMDFSKAWIQNDGTLEVLTQCGGVG
jgi:hypothetical protein